MATITITDIDRRNLSLTYNDGVITTTYTILKYTCSLEQEANTLHLRWRNDATDSRLYFSLEWSEVTSPVTADADALKVLLLRLLASCDKPREVVRVLQLNETVNYDDSVIICDSGGGGNRLDLTKATDMRSIHIVNYSGGNATITCDGADEINLRGSLSSTLTLKNHHDVYLVSDGISKYYAVTHNNIQT
jgi:hypothetical protein